MPAKKSPTKKTATKRTASPKRVSAAATKKPSTAKKAPAKRISPKSAPRAKKASASKASAKKLSSKKAPVAKNAPVAKKAAGKAPSARAESSKAAASKATPTKADWAKAAPTKTAAKKGKRAEKKSLAGPIKTPFSVKDKVVYPHHGAATIIKKQKLEFDGEKIEYFVLEVATDQLIVRVPVARAVELGVRPVISRTVARKVFATFKDDPQEAGANWSRWYKLLTEKINSGDIFQVAEVVRDLTYAQQVKGISPALKRMLAKARLIIISELRFALDLGEEATIAKLDRALPTVEEDDDE